MQRSQQDIHGDHTVLWIEVPHQAEVTATTFQDVDALHASWQRRAAESQGRFEQWVFDSPDDEHTAAEWVLHDLHSAFRLDVYEAIECVRNPEKWSERHRDLEIVSACAKWLDAIIEEGASGAAGGFYDAAVEAYFWERKGEE